QFRRQAATRMVFDAAQNIPLSSLRPAKVIDLDLMHPELQADSGITWTFKDGGLCRDGAFCTASQAEAAWHFRAEKRPRGGGR
ncbi:MAG: hypothetical protein RLZZ191_1578, partial [Pseudomonadota bacterium]